MFVKWFLECYMVWLRYLTGLVEGFNLTVEMLKPDPASTISYDHFETYLFNVIHALLPHSKKECGDIG